MKTFNGLSGYTYNIGDKPISKAGDGHEYELVGHPDKLAKIYNPHSRNTSAEEKLLAMLNLQPRTTEYCLWPMDALYENGQFAGLVKSKIVGMERLRKYYANKNRKNFPWTLYIAIAKNLSLAVHHIHESGLIIGDLNHDSILIDPKTGSIVLTDAENYHIVDSTGFVHRCVSGMLEYVAPELEGVNFEASPLPTFTMKTDLFSLSILVFSLLMNGAHPFVSRENLLNGVSAYFSESSGSDTKISNYSPGLDSLPDDLYKLFRRAFVSGLTNPSLRPSAEEFYYALEHLENNIKNCSENFLHHYYLQATCCPWCKLEGQKRPDFEAGAISAHSMPDDSFETDSHSKPIGQLIDFDSHHKAHEQPKELDPRLRMFEQPIELDPRLKMFEQPIELDPRLKMFEQPADVSRLNIYEQPADASRLNTYEPPADIAARSMTHNMRTDDHSSYSMPQDSQPQSHMPSYAYEAASEHSFSPVDSHPVAENKKVSIAIIALITVLVLGGTVLISLALLSTSGSNGNHTDEYYSAVISEEADQPPDTEAIPTEDPLPTVNPEPVEEPLPTQAPEIDEEHLPSLGSDQEGSEDLNDTSPGDVPTAGSHVYLIDLDFVYASSEHGGFLHYSFVQDNLGNTYDNGLGGVDVFDNFQEYEINGEFNTISGTIVLNFDFRLMPHFETFVRIFGDGELLYESPLITVGVGPEPFSVDITDVDVLRVSIFGQHMIRIVDCILY